MSKAGLLKDIIDDMKAGVFDYTVDGKCSSCGNCCSNFLPLSAKDIKEIKRYIKKHHIEPSKHQYPFSVEMYDLVCPFRSESEKKCTIYEVRPMICRDFQCDKPHKNIEADKALFHQRYMAYDVRELFFGEQGKE